MVTTQEPFRRNSCILLLNKKGYFYFVVFLVRENIPMYRDIMQTRDDMICSFGKIFKFYIKIIFTHVMIFCLQKWSVPKQLAF